MVDVSAKSPSVREATAAGEIAMSITTADLIKSGDAKKVLNNFLIILL